MATKLRSMTLVVTVLAVILPSIWSYTKTCDGNCNQNQVIDCPSGESCTLRCQEERRRRRGLLNSDGGCKNMILNCAAGQTCSVEVGYDR